MHVGIDPSGDLKDLLVLRLRAQNRDQGVARATLGWRGVEPLVPQGLGRLVGVQR